MSKAEHLLFGHLAVYHIMIGEKQSCHNLAVRTDLLSSAAALYLTWLSLSMEGAVQPG